jgi:DNA repair exonuclease SbcCD ATPase subunit
MEVNEAVKAQKLDSAKLVYDAAIQGAKKTLETKTEEYLAEVENMKTALLKAQLTNQVAIAKLKDNTVGLEALSTKYKAWTDAQDDVVDKLADVQKKQLEFLDNKDRATDSITKVGAIEEAKKALEQAKDNLEHTKTTLANSGSDGFAALWKEYQEKVDGVDAKTKQLNGELTKLQEDLKLLSKAETAAKEALDAKTEPITKALDKAVTDAQNAVTGLENTIKKAAEVAVACGNTVLSGLVATEDLSYKTHDKDGNEVEGKFELKEGKFVASTDVRANDAAAVAKNIKAAFDKYAADQLLQNKKNYEAVKDKINSLLNDNLTTLGANDTKGLRKEWADYTKAYNNAVAKNDKAAFATAEANLQAKAIEIFGDYADETKTFTVGDKTVKGGFGYFVGVSISSDNSILDLLVKAGLAKSAQDIEWNRFGAYGAWKQLDVAFGSKDEKLNIGGDNAYMRTIMEDAATASKAVQAFVDTYTNAKKAADDKLTAAKNAKNSTKVEESDAVKTEKAAYDAAKKAREDKDNEIKAANKELTPIADQKAYDDVMAKYYKGLLDAVSATTTSADAYDTYMEFATSEQQYNVTKAQAELEKAKKDLANYDEGKYAAEADIEAAEKALKKAIEDEAEAKAEYEKLKGYYGK